MLEAGEVFVGCREHERAHMTPGELLPLSYYGSAAEQVTRRGQQNLKTSHGANELWLRAWFDTEIQAHGSSGKFGSSGSKRGGKLAEGMDVVE